MFCEEIKIPGLPGEGTVTDGSVDWYEMDWENVDNGVTEEQMPRNVDNRKPALPGRGWLLAVLLIWEKFPDDRGQASRKMTQV